MRRVSVAAARRGRGRRDAGERAEAGRLDLLAQQSPCQLLARLLVGDRVAQQRADAARHGLGRWLLAGRELSESDLRQEVERVVELGERGPIRVRIRSELRLRDTLRSLRGGLGRLGAVASRTVRGEHHGRRLAERRDGVGILAAPVVAQCSRDSLALLDEVVRRDGEERFGFLGDVHAEMVAIPRSLADRVRLGFAPGTPIECRRMRFIAAIGS